jgi:hypothetical protein
MSEAVEDKQGVEFSSQARQELLVERGGHSFSVIKDRNMGVF